MLKESAVEGEAAANGKLEGKGDMAVNLVSGGVQSMERSRSDKGGSGREQAAAAKPEAEKKAAAKKDADKKMAEKKKREASEVGTSGRLVPKPKSYFLDAHAGRP